MPPTPNDPECAWLHSRICAYKSLRSSEGACCPMCRAPHPAGTPSSRTALPILQHRATNIAAKYPPSLLAARKAATREEWAEYAATERREARAACRRRCAPLVYVGSILFLALLVAFAGTIPAAQCGATPVMYCPLRRCCPAQSPPGALACCNVTGASGGYYQPLGAEWDG